MSQTTTDTDTAIATIADVDLWSIVAESVNTIASKKEAVFEFRPDVLRVCIADAGQVALLNMQVDASGFESYDVNEVDFGLNTERLADVLSAIESDIVEVTLNDETRRLEIRGDTVEYDMAGLDPDTVSASPIPIPDLDDEAKVADAELPVEEWATGSNLIDLAGPDHGTFAYKSDAGDLALVGVGDTDRSRVVLSDHDAFEWNTEPDDDVECLMSNDYMGEVIDIVEDGDDADGTVHFTIGVNQPYQVDTSHADGRISTQLMQAPRIVNQ